MKEVGRKLMGDGGWGTRIRTSVNGARTHRPAAERSPSVFISYGIQLESQGKTLFHRSLSCPGKGGAPWKHENAVSDRNRQISPRPSLRKRGKTGGTKASSFVKGDRRGIWENGAEGQRSEAIRDRKSEIGNRIPYGEGMRLKGLA